MERPHVCKPSINATKHLPLVGTVLWPIRKQVDVTETLRADKMEDHLYILIFDISQTHWDRSPEQGEVQEKKYSIFVAWSLMRVSAAQDFVFPENLGLEVVELCWVYSEELPPQCHCSVCAGMHSGGGAV